MWSNMDNTHKPDNWRHNDEYNAYIYNVNTVLIFHNNFTDRDTTDTTGQTAPPTWLDIKVFNIPDMITMHVMGNLSLS